MLSKNANNKKFAPKLIFFNEKKIEKDSDNFCHRKLTLKVRFCHFLKIWHYVCWQKTVILIEHVEFFLKFHLIQYPSLGNLTTHIAIFQTRPTPNGGQVRLVIVILLSALLEIGLSASHIEKKSTQSRLGRRRVQGHGACKFFTYVTKTCANLTTYSRKPENYNAPTYLLLPLGKWGSKWGDFHWAMGCV